MRSNQINNFQMKREDFAGLFFVYDRGVARTVVMCRHCIAPNGGRCGRGSPPSSGGGGSQGPSPRNF